MDKAGGGDNPEGATDTRVGNSSRASDCRLVMGDSAAALIAAAVMAIAGRGLMRRVR